jgi:hypothetical protein
MKKVFFGSAFVLLTIVALSSCKKYYTCTCSVTNGQPGDIPSVTKTTIKNTTKKNAKSVCGSGSLTVGSLTTTCTLD